MLIRQSRSKDQQVILLPGWEEGKPYLWSVFCSRLNASSFYLLSSFIPHSDLVKEMFYPYVTYEETEVSTSEKVSKVT